MCGYQRALMGVRSPFNVDPRVRTQAVRFGGRWQCTISPGPLRYFWSLLVLDLKI